MTTIERISKLSNVPATTLSEEQIAENKTRFIQIFEENVPRKGAKKLLDYLKKSDFFVAPASTKYHMSCKGGLCAHSLNVYDALTAKLSEKQFKEVYRLDYSAETVAIAALFHDFCKVMFYDVELRNRKNEQGVWEQVPVYTVENDAPLGHGSKSVVGLMKFIDLTKPEMYAIWHHMGFTEGEENHNDVRTTFDMYRLALALFEADMEATYWMENVKEHLG